MDELQIQRILDTLKTSFIDVMRKIDLDKSDLVKNSKFIWKNNNVEVIMDDYYTFVDKGRRRGRQPPISSILTWMNDKGIRAPSGTTQEQLAFAIARSIGDKGLKARPFVNTLALEMQDILSKYIYSKVNEILSKTLTKR